MARGGRRDGKVGTAYSNRSDLTQAPTAATGQTYGEAKAQLDAQKVIPLPTAASAGGGPPAPAPTQPAGAAPVMEPGALPFDRPTDRPDEPVTAGLPFGAGPGPEAVTNPFQIDVIGAQLYELYRQSPNNDLLRLIELHDQGF